MIQDIQPTKTILCKFQQTLAKGTISHRGATLRANVEQHFKDKSHNAFSKQYRSFLLLQYERLAKKFTTGYILLNF